MADADAYVLGAIRSWVWSGFYSADDCREMLQDIIEPDQDENTLYAAIDREFKEKNIAEKSWPKVTDYDRLHAVFYKLHEDGICALHNAGYTMSDGHSDVAEVVADAPEGHYHAYCFYHGQDVERAIEGHGLMIAFGDLDDVNEESVAVGFQVRDALVGAGFLVEWDGTQKTRLSLPQIKWLKRLG